MYCNRRALVPFSKLFVTNTNRLHLSQSKLLAPSRFIHKFADGIDTISSVMADHNISRSRAKELYKKRIIANKGKNYGIINQAAISLLHDNCLYVSSEGRKYLFNVPDGTQRLFYLNGLKILDMENIFLTRPKWSHVSGAIGISLTLQDIGSIGLTLHSTDGIENFFDSTKSFMSITSGMNCTTRNLTQGDYVDRGIRIHPILDEHWTTSTDSKSHDDVDEQIVKKARPTKSLIAYSCSLPDLPGALIPQKCQELGVPVGPLLRELKSGQDVTLPNGQVVKSSDVCERGNKGLHFLILECPTLSHFKEKLLKNSELNKIRDCRIVSDSENPVGLIIHMISKEVADDPSYRNWMKGFPENCKHLLKSNQEDEIVKFLPCHRFQYLLNQLDCTIFPKLYLTQAQKERLKSEAKLTYEQMTIFPDGVDHHSPDLVSVEKGDFVNMDNEIYVRPMDTFFLRPKRHFESLDTTCGMDILYEEAKYDPEFGEKLKSLHEEQKTLPESKEFEPEVVFLGTGSAVPSKLRTVSCVLLNFNYPKKFSAILDCGEDSYGQMLRLYGPDKTKEVLMNLKFIYISHHHADHHTGIANLLQQRLELTKEPLILLAPPRVHELILYSSQYFEDISNSYKFFSTKDMHLNNVDRQYLKFASQNVERVIKELDGLIDDIKLVEVVHCADACAAMFKFKIGHPEMDTFTVCYSGDTVPSRDFVLIGQQCDLLIHEATFDHNYEIDARAKKHSTTHQAIQIGRDMKAKFTILTHFSQRMPKIPYFTKEFDDNVGFAFDNLVLKCPSHFKRLPIMKPVLETIFKESIHQMDVKLEKRELREHLVGTVVEDSKL